MNCDAWPARRCRARIETTSRSRSRKPARIETYLLSTAKTLPVPPTWTRSSSLHPPIPQKCQSTEAEVQRSFSPHRVQFFGCIGFGPARGAAGFWMAAVVSLALAGAGVTGYFLWISRDAAGSVSNHQARIGGSRIQP